MKKAVLTDYRVSGDCVSRLEALGFAVVRLPSFRAISEPVAAHPDMLIYKLDDHGSRLLLHRDYYAVARDVLDPLGVELVLTDEPIRAGYPDEILLNALRVGGKVYAKAESVSTHIASTADEVVSVKQGYAACSVALLREDAAITADKGLGAALEKNGVNVLYVRQGHIELDGYDYGFIGGCGGSLAPDLYAFFGDIETHPDGADIRAFAERFGVRIMSLCDRPLRDFGGMTVIEKA